MVWTKFYLSEAVWLGETSPPLFSISGAGCPCSSTDVKPRICFFSNTACCFCHRHSISHDSVIPPAEFYMYKSSVMFFWGRWVFRSDKKSISVLGNRNTNCSPFQLILKLEDQDRNESYKLCWFPWKVHCRGAENFLSPLTSGSERYSVIHIRTLLKLLTVVCCCVPAELWIGSSCIGYSTTRKCHLLLFSIILWFLILTQRQKAADVITGI